MSVHIKKDGRWFVVYSEEQKRKERYFGRGDIAGAQARRFDEEKKREKGKVASHCGVTIEELLSAYHRHHPVMDTTAQSDFYRIDRLLVPNLGRIEAESLTSQHLNEYVTRRLEAGIKRRSVARELSILKAALSWAERQEPPVITRNPAAKYIVPKARVSEIPQPPTVDEVKRILKHCARHVIRGLLIEYFMGTRPGRETNGIMWADVNWEEHEIRVVSARKGGPVVRYVTIHEHLAEHLPLWRTEDIATIQHKQALIDIESVKIVNYGLKPVISIKKAWKTAKLAAGVTRRIRLYDFRHAWFTNAIKAGGDIKAISETGGHSRVDTTLITYHHVGREEHREAIHKMPGIPGLDLSQKLAKKLAKE